MQQTAERTTSKTANQSRKSKKIEDIVKPDATMRLHQRLFDRRRKNHIDVRAEEGAHSPGKSLSSYLISPKYRKKSRNPKRTAAAAPALVTTVPAPVLQYSQITRKMPAENYLIASLAHTRSLIDRIAQRYRVFTSQHKPLYYSMGAGTTTGWLKDPRARVALAGSALALVAFFAGTPFSPPAGPDNPAGQNPVVIQDTSKGSASQDTGTLSHQSEPGSTPSAQSGNANTASNTPAQPPTPTTISSQPMPLSMPASGGGYGSGPTTIAPTQTNQTPSQPVTQSPTIPTTDLIQDIIKPTPVTLPGQDIKVDDKRILQTSDTTILIN